jgi:hypothetical protein
MKFKMLLAFLVMNLTGFVFGSESPDSQQSSTSSTVSLDELYDVTLSSQMSDFYYKNIKLKNVKEKAKLGFKLLCYPYVKDDNTVISSLTIQSRKKQIGLDLNKTVHN